MTEKSLYSYSNNETVSCYAIYKCLSLRFNTFKTILVMKLMFMNFGYNCLKNIGLKVMTV